MSVSPSIGSSGVVTLSLFSNKKGIPDDVAIISVLTENSINGISTAKLVVQDGDMQSQDFPVSNSETFDLGNEIEIYAGYGSHEEKIFQGIIVKHGLEITLENKNLLHIECGHIAENAARKKMSTTLLKIDASPSLIVTYGEDLMEFFGEIDGRIESSNPITSQFHIQGHMKFQGSAKAQLGALIEIRRVGARLSGRVLIWSVKHELTKGNWITEVKFYKHVS